MDAKIITTIGELIQDKRRSLDMTITQLSELSGVHRGTISRIENGEVKRPEFSSVHLLATALNIPFETLVDSYVEIEKKADTLLSMLQTTIAEGSNAELIKKVATKYLRSPNQDSIDLTEKLYQQINSIEDTSIKLSLYNLIIDYSRSHGIMPYIAKGLYQQYLIERNDFSKLNETYYSGKYILNYMDFLPQHEKIELYYKLGIHALNLKLFRESIENCKNVLVYGDSPYKVHALGVLRDAHFGLGEYKESELYSIQYKQFDYPHIRENTLLMEALIHAKQGKIDLSIQQLSSFVETCSHDYVVPAINQLLRLYLQRKELDQVGKLIENSEIDPTVLNQNNPLVRSRYADHLQLKGEYYFAVGEAEKGISYVLESALEYSKINDTIEEKKCLNMVVSYHLENNISMNKGTLEQLGTYFTT
ncbi:helix-turn-helix domain-containing protein [Paenibacillus alvei]|uniref:helix-turn-helix domain-containing protein n=1 Tax=Paenibacillus alvei TaxID=44250 RepID=UPI0013DD07F1|nr:helix-turn-helix transcriptional regulator [Paenibacillus alvei]NEZ42880.1 helix-turn-helix domain-containing protein [Paenibacillus alvei]